MSYMPSHLLLCVSVFLFAFVYQGKAYDPLETFESIETLDRKIKDKSRDRSIPLNPNHHRVISDSVLPSGMRILETKQRQGRGSMEILQGTLWKSGTAG